MKKPNAVNFEKIIELNNRLKERYLYTIASHKAFGAFNSLNIISQKGKSTAENNVKVIRKYNNYFHPAKEGIRYYLIIELAKFYETGNDSLSVYNVLDYSEQNLSVLGKKYFLEFHKERKFITSDIESYKEITKADIEKFRARIKRNIDKIKRVKKYRDEYIAHDDLNKKKYKVNSRDISVLLKIVKDIIDFYVLKLEWAGTYYDNFEKEPVKDLNRLFKDLRKYDVYQKKEWKRKWREKYGQE